MRWELKRKFELEKIGGRAQVFNINGFKHDAGPTVITAPFMFDDLFKLFNEDRKKYKDSHGKSNGW